MDTPDSPDDHYARTHELLDAARTATADPTLTGPIRKVLHLLIEALDASTLGWSGLDLPEEAATTAPLSEIPTLRTLVIQGKNCVSALNEYAQQHGVEMPRYDHFGAGPFQCTCYFAGREVGSQENQRTKNDAKHDAAEQMLAVLRGQQ